MEVQSDYYLKACRMWLAFSTSEKHGVRFGLFPHGKMAEAEKDGFTDTSQLALALMAIADKK